MPEEFAIQKKALQVFHELERELSELEDQFNVLGWKQRNALIDHVCSDYRSAMVKYLNLS